MRFVCSFWIIGLCCCYAQECPPFESRIEPVGLSLSLHCSEEFPLFIWNLHDLLNCTVFTSSSGSFPCGWVCSFRLQLAVLFYFFGFWGPFPGCFSFESIHACTACARHRRRCPRGHRSRGCEALFLRASRPTSLTSSLRSCTVVLLCHRSLLVHDSSLLLAVVCRRVCNFGLLTSAVVTAFA